MAWNKPKDDAYRIKIYSWSQLVRQVGIGAFEIVQTAQAEGLTADGVLQDGTSVTAAEVLAMIGVAGDTLKFLQNLPVPTADREADVARILAGPLQ